MNKIFVIVVMIFVLLPFLQLVVNIFFPFLGCPVAVVVWAVSMSIVPGNSVGLNLLRT